VENVRLLIANPMWVGVGEGSDVKVGGANIPTPNRGQVERWLSEKAAGAAKEEKRRHDRSSSGQSRRRSLASSAC
jgi:hypothetical protein